MLTWWKIVESKLLLVLSNGIWLPLYSVSSFNHQLPFLFYKRRILGVFLLKFIIICQGKFVYAVISNNQGLISLVIIMDPTLLKLRKE